MAIEKKSLISTLKTTKKANIAGGKATNNGSSTRKAIATKHASIVKSGVVRGKM
jgi:hypothetical protein